MMSDIINFRGNCHLFFHHKYAYQWNILVYNRIDCIAGFMELDTLKDGNYAKLHFGIGNRIKIS